MTRCAAFTVGFVSARVLRKHGNSSALLFGGVGRFHHFSLFAGGALIAKADRATDRI